jgi:tRNA A-37 threonylcarbamoyl transferase component Bud32
MLLDLTNIPNLLPWMSSSSSNNSKGCDRERTDDSDCRFEKALGLSLERFQASRDRNSQIPRLSPDDIGIGKKLGEGAFGIIHKVQYLSETALILQQPQNKTGYAVKQLHPRISNKHKRRRLQAIVDFETERRILSCIHHPNIVQVYGIVRQPHSTMIVMDRLFETLDTRLVQWRRTHLRELYLTGNILGDEDIDINPKRLQIALDVASALDYLHSQNIMHRDVKSSNVAFDMVRALVDRIRYILRRESFYG